MAQIKISTRYLVVRLPLELWGPSPRIPRIAHSVTLAVVDNGRSQLLSPHEATVSAGPVCAACKACATRQRGCTNNGKHEPCFAVGQIRMENCDLQQNLQASKGLIVAIRASRRNRKEPLIRSRLLRAGGETPRSHAMSISGDCRQTVPRSSRPPATQRLVTTRSACSVRTASSSRGTISGRLLEAPLAPGPSAC